MAVPIVPSVDPISVLQQFFLRLTDGVSSGISADPCVFKYMGGLGRCSGSSTGEVDTELVASRSGESALVNPPRPFVE
jgi:hypothetical protein